MVWTRVTGALTLTRTRTSGLADPCHTLAATITGPNDASGIVWGLGMFFCCFSSCFLLQPFAKRLALPDSGIKKTNQNPILGFTGLGLISPKLRPFFVIGNT